MSQFRVLSFSVALMLGMQAWLLGCAFSKDHGKDKDKVSAQVLSNEDQLFEEELKIEIGETEELNKYFVKFSWPKGKKIRVEVRDGDSIISSDNGAFSLVIPIDGGTTAKFAVAAYNSLGGVLFNKLSIQTAPEDLLVRGDLEITKDQVWNYNRIVLEKDARIALNGHDLVINANSLNAVTGATISTLDSSVRPMLAKEKDDLNGPQIMINAKKALGRLKIYLVGYMGRNGRSGDEIDQANKVSASTFLPELKGASGVDGKTRCGGNPRGEADRVCTCVEQPTDGKPGLSGKAGTDGEDGEPGGNTGSLSVQTENRRPLLSIDVIARPGAPGKGGAGGTGWRGGEGGEPGKGGNECRTARKGAEGPRGPKGKPGKDGAPGKVSKIVASPGVLIELRD